MLSRVVLESELRTLFAVRRCTLAWVWRLSLRLSSAVLSKAKAKATQRGDDWRISHDGYERVLLDTIFRCGVKGVEQPAGLFGAVLPPRRGRRRGRRSGMVPDAMLYRVPLEADVAPRY